MMRRLFFAALLLPLLFVAASCAPRGAGETLLPRERLFSAQERTFRHTVRVAFPGTRPSFSFDGVLRLRNTETGPEARVVCLGPLGLTLCDMTITPDGYRTDLLHPSLARVPHVAGHIARRVGDLCRELLTGTPHPPRIVFSDEDAGYTVTIRLVAG